MKEGGVAFRSPKVLAAVALGLIIAAVCIRLGFWQLDRLESRRTSNALIQQAMERPALTLDGPTLNRLLQHPESLTYRVATATGTFDHPHDILLRGRSDRGRPGVHLVTPLRLPAGGTLLVNRGWLPAPDAATVDPRPHRTAGETTVTGILQPVPDLTEPERPVVVEPNGSSIITFRRLDHQERETALGTELPRLYLQLLPRDTGADLPIPVPAPELDEGPHLGYAIQWFGFAAIALLGLLIVGLRRRWTARSMP